MAREPLTRERLVYLIGVMPGVHVRLAARVLGVGIGTVVHHIRTLLEERRLRKERDGRYVRLYPTSSKGSVSKDLAKRYWKLRNPAERILRALAREPLRLVEVAARVGVSKQLAYYHLNRMAEEGLVAKRRHEGTRRYALALSLEGELQEAPEG